MQRKTTPPQTAINPAAVWPAIFEAISNGASLAEAMHQPNMPSLAWAKRNVSSRLI